MTSGRQCIEQISFLLDIQIRYQLKFLFSIISQHILHFETGERPPDRGYIAHVVIDRVSPSPALGFSTTRPRSEIIHLQHTHDLELVISGIFTLQGHLKQVEQNQQSMGAIHVVETSYSSQEC